MNKKTKKIIVISICSVIGALLLSLIGYLLYVVLSYHRIEDNLELSVINGTEDIAPVNERLSIMTYNIGFGAYSKDYSFFMDGGKYSRAYSKNEVIKNTNGALDAVKKESPNFVFFQEVDTYGTRSYHVDQSQMLKDGLSGYDSIFAENYDSAYFIYPFNQPIGANKSGIMTFSSYDVTSAHRRSLPIEESLYKFLDLDRAYSVSYVKVSNGKTLVLFNVHLSAYTSDGTIANEQLKILSAEMEAEYKKGNYIIAGGDFNKDMLGDSSKYFERSEGDFTWAKPFDTSLLPSFIKAYTGSNYPTCRNADSAFRGDGTDYVLSVDGFLVSDNIEVTSSETVEIGFEYSDHNPVILEFSLKDQ